MARHGSRTRRTYAALWAFGCAFVLGNFGDASRICAQAPSLLMVDSSADFITAVNTINSNTNTNYTIVFNQNVTLTGQALPIMTNAAITFDGNGRTLDGGGAYRPFFIESGTVALKNMTIANAQAQGGNGGGGGLGAGAAVFVDSSGRVSLQNVQFSNNAAIGGNGSTQDTQGGGGLGGNGGPGGNSGGGGLYGNGGQHGGGGGGALGNGGNGLAPFAGGGGGGMTADGTNAYSLPFFGFHGGSGGADGGGNGADEGANGSPGGIGGGGGAGAGGLHGTSNAGAGGLFGGGGGLGGFGTAGAGGRFGGGGGGSNGNAGSGGFGGGGGNGYVGDSDGGNGGFGAGSGSGTVGGIAGFGGGNGASGANSGGGGAAFGGALFVVQGGSLTILQGVGFTNNTVTAGTGNQNGSADGADLFLMRGVSTTFDIAGGQSLTFAPTLGNNDGTANPDVVITKTGAGTLILTGTNSLVGATTVDAGTLQIDGLLHGATTINSGTAAVLGTLSGTTVVNQGRLVVSGTLDGPAVVNNGGVFVANGQTLGTVDVNNGGLLQGSGVVGNAALHGGSIIAPGNSIGTITVSGNFTQSSGSTYVAEVSTTGADKIVVTGTAAILNGATFQAVVAPGNYQAGQTFTVLTASGGITGTYASSILPSLGGGLQFRLNYDNPFEIDLYVARAFRFVDLAGTQNQNAVAGILDQLYDAGGGLPPLLAQLQAVDPAQLPALFEQLSGSFNGSLAAVDLQNANIWMQILSSRFAGPVGATSPGSNSFADLETATHDAEVQLVSYRQSDGRTTDVPYMVVRRRRADVGWTGWTQGYGVGGNVAGGGGAGGVGYGVGGTLFGADRALSDRFSAGFFGGYAGSSVTNSAAAASARINAYQFGFYQRFRSGPFYATNFDAYSNSAYDSSRAVPLVGTATGKSIGNQYAHYSEAGLTFGGGPIQVQPFTGLQYVYLNQTGFTESGAGALGLVVGSQSVTSLRSNVGLRLFSEIVYGPMRFTPSVAARYQREFGDGTQLVTSSFVGAPTVGFVTAGNTLGRDFGLFSLGIQADLGGRVGVFGSCDTQVADRYTAVLGSGGFQFNW